PARDRLLPTEPPHLGEVAEEVDLAASFPIYIDRAQALAAENAWVERSAGVRKKEHGVLRSRSTRPFGELCQFGRVQARIVLNSCNERDSRKGGQRNGGRESGGQRGRKPKRHADGGALPIEWCKRKQVGKYKPARGFQPTLLTKRSSTGQCGAELQ